MAFQNTSCMWHAFASMLQSWRSQVCLDAYHCWLSGCHWSRLL